MKKNWIFGMILLSYSFQTQAQAPDASISSSASSSSSASTPTKSTSQTSEAGSSFLGKDVPFFNPGNEIVSWDGKNWNINNNRIFQARFEKYLNAPEESSQEDLKYQGIIKNILQKLAPYNTSGQNLDEAFSLLRKASDFQADAHLCDALADAVYSMWLTKRDQNRLVQANEELQKQRAMHERNAQRSATPGFKTAAPSSKDAATSQEWSKEQQTARDLKLQPDIQRLAEVNATIAKNALKKELSEVQSKIEFQSLIVQFFVQRRFQHVLMATRFYRHLCENGDTSLKLDGDAKAFFSKSTGMPPTVGTLDSMSNEIISDVREGVEAYKFLLQKNELESATKRLGEVFVVGEYLPEIKTLPREQKRQALAFAQKSNQLISAIEVKDYTSAENLVKELQSLAKDFDTSKPMAVIETAKTVSQMHLAKAKNAAVSGDRQTLESELKEATAIWPRNPALAEVSSLIFSQADIQQQALVDFDQLLSQRNYRQIFDDKIRFIAATALYPNRREKLTKVLEDMQMIESSIIRCTEIAKRGDYAGAWENIENIFKQFPDDSKLNKVRAELTTEAAEFVRTLKTAQQLEEKGQIGSSLSWYLKAQKLYPQSEFAQTGIQRLTKKIFPDG